LSDNFGIFAKNIDSAMYNLFCRQLAESFYIRITFLWCLQYNAKTASRYRQTEQDLWSTTSDISSFL